MQNIPHFAVFFFMMALEVEGFVEGFWVDFFTTKDTKNHEGFF